MIDYFDRLTDANCDLYSITTAYFTSNLFIWLVQDNSKSSQLTLSGFPGIKKKKKC